jgi:hypothetical protein
VPQSKTTAKARPRSRRTLYLIAALVVLVAGICLCADRQRSGDMYLLLFSGRYVVDHGLVSHDPFPTIEHGAEWLNQQWLSEVAFYATYKVIGITGITVLYAIVLALPLGVALALIRRKSTAALVVLTALYVPGLLAIIHPRAAGFTLLLFSLLLVAVAVACDLVPLPGRMRVRPLWAIVPIPLLFALWANLHGGFIAGLVLIGLVVAGLIIDRWRGIRGTVEPRLITALAASGALAVAVVTFATPLGIDLWSYLASFRNSALSVASTEWEPVTQSVAGTAYVVLAACVGVWLWWHTPRPRAVMPALVTAGLLVFAAASMRNIIFVGPALVLQMVAALPDRAAEPSRLVLAAASAVAAVSLAVFAFLGPADNEHVGYPAVQYAIDHPPADGRIAAYAGPSSYILWRRAETRVVIDGWLEHFTATQLRGNFGLLHGTIEDPGPVVRRLDVGAVIAHIPEAVERLEHDGFEAEFTGPDGTYLVRPRADGGGG